MPRRAFALVAHPDDIEFGMAGTLIRLKQEAGYEIHMMNIANGSCGSTEVSAEEIAEIRVGEARAAAELIGAVYHPPLVNDLEIFYTEALLARVGAVMREVAPDLLFIHSPQDYMEDHMNACRLGLTAAFSRGMPNFPTDPPRDPVDTPVTVYHAQPHGNRDPLGALVSPSLFVEISQVLDQKFAMLEMHRSQKVWLDHSQGMDSYLTTMQDMGREVGELSGRFEYAEGFRRHLHAGYCEEQADPLREVFDALD
jgi:LmbE family N-acetylglucosaminyl deacetylase